MIIKGVLSAMNIEPVTSTGVPAGANVHIDFVNGIYWRNGAFVAVEDLIDGIDSIGGDGLVVLTANSNRPVASPTLLGDFVSGFVDGMTLVMEWERTGSDGPVFAAFDDADPNSALKNLYAEDFGNFIESYDDADLEMDTEAVVVTGDNKMAVTWAQDHGSAEWRNGISANGSGATELPAQPNVQDLSYDFSGVGPSSVFFSAIEPFSWIYESVLKTITLYPARDTDDLPGLSSLS